MARSKRRDPTASNRIRFEPRQRAAIMRAEERPRAQADSRILVSLLGLAAAARLSVVVSSDGDLGKEACRLPREPVAAEFTEAGTAPARLQVLLLR